MGDNLGRERLGDEPLRGAVDTGIGDGIEPVDELSVEVVKAAKAATEIVPDQLFGAFVRQIDRLRLD